MSFSTLFVNKLACIPKQCSASYTIVRTSMSAPISRIEDGVIKDYNPDNVQHVRMDVTPGRPQIGYGMNSEKYYFDKNDFPYPAVRYKVDTPQILALREKEKGDWKNLSIAEKKELYRASFRQTFAEIDTPDGRFRYIWGWSFFLHGVCFWWAMFIYWLLGVKENDRQGTITLEARQAQLQRLIAMRDGYLTGIASKWDYEKDDWKEEYKHKFA